MEYLKTLEIISNILVAITLIIIWIDYTMEIPIKAVYNLRVKLNVKPFNCLWCLSWWVGVILTIITFDYIYLSLPLITRTIYR